MGDGERQLAQGCPCIESGGIPSRGNSAEFYPDDRTESDVFEQCDCGSGSSYVACCGRLHAGSVATTAEELMRSRYTAFCRGDVAYLLKSWAVETRPMSLSLDPAQEWTGLQIERHEVTGSDTATVQFTATWLKATKKGQLAETSRFRREADGWVYVDGILG